MARELEHRELVARSAAGRWPAVREAVPQPDDQLEHARVGLLRRRNSLGELGDVARVRDRDDVARELRPLALDVGRLERPQLAARDDSW